jgi:pyruvate formate lyase activating enzyme
LRCKYCLNPFSFDESTKKKILTPKELYTEVKIDELYFLATGGGVTFGGGEPLLYPEFLTEFREICGKEWHLCVETSLNVPFENVLTASKCIDYFIIDCKDTNAQIYKSYRGKDNTQMLSNLSALVSIIGSERITVRIPNIPDFNTRKDVEKSINLLSNVGIVNFDIFNYRI